MGTKYMEGILMTKSMLTGQWQKVHTTDRVLYGILIQCLMDIQSNLNCNNMNVLNWTHWK